MDMSNEMIEKVAKAIAVIDCGHAQDTDFFKRYWDMVMAADYHLMARAAIEAMREPTDEQRNHYFDLKRESGSTEAYSTFEDATWLMMIEACLKERRA